MEVWHVINLDAKELNFFLRVFCPRLADRRASALKTGTDTAESIFG